MVIVRFKDVVWIEMSMGQSENVWNNMADTIGARTERTDLQGHVTKDAKFTTRAAG